MTKTTTTHEYVATYADGKQLAVFAGNVYDAVMSAAELNDHRVIRVMPAEAYK